MAASAPATVWRPARAALAAGVVVRLRPGAQPVVAPGVTALCLDVTTSDTPKSIRTALDELRAAGHEVRCRPPEILFDADAWWWDAVAGLRWQAVYARHLAHLAARAPVVLEYPLQGLNVTSTVELAHLAGMPPAAVVVSPELSLDQIGALSVSAPALEILAFGRQQVLATRDQLGRAEGLVGALGPAEHARLLLADAKGFVFPVEVDAAGSRIGNARVTNVGGHLQALRAAGVSTFVVEQAALGEDERDAFASGGLEALAAFAARERSTTGHLFRGVA
jgi:hypothetical protein